MSAVELMVADFVLWNKMAPGVSVEAVCSYKDKTCIVQFPEQTIYEASLTNVLCQNLQFGRKKS